MSSILKVNTLQDVNGNAIISSDGSGNLSIPNLTTAGDINFGDNDKAVFGAGSDLEIYHDGSNSYVWDTGTGNLILVSDGSGIEFKKNNGEYLASFSNDGPATLYYDNSAKLATTSNGVDVTGTVVSDGLTVDTNTLYVDSTNNRVGIGTTSGSYRVNVGAPSSVTGLEGVGMTLFSQSLTSNVGGVLNFRQGLGTTTSDIFNLSICAYDHSGDGNADGLSINGSDGVSFSTGSNSRSERMLIDSSGTVQIGSSSSTGSRELRIDTGSGSTVGQDSIISSYRSNADLIIKTNDTERMRIDSSGRLLVGTTSTTINTSNFGFVFDASTDVLKTSRNVNGTGTSAEHFGNAGQFRVMGDGDAENTNNSYGALSDRTLKENETDANSQWNDIKALQIKNYNLIEYPDRPQIGVIAQDLEDAGMNGLVKTDDEGLKSVKYSVLYMKAVKALQEALIEIDNLKARVNTLEGN